MAPIIENIKSKLDALVNYYDIESNLFSSENTTTIETAIKSITSDINPDAKVKCLFQIKNKKIESITIEVEDIIPDPREVS